MSKLFETSKIVKGSDLAVGDHSVTAASNVAIAERQTPESEYVCEIRLSRHSQQRLKHAVKQGIGNKLFMVDRDAAEMREIGEDALRSVLCEDDLIKLREFGAGRGVAAVKITGLPGVDPMPDTPYTGFGDDTVTQFADCIHLGVFGLMDSDPVAFSFENDKHLFRNVVPNPNAYLETSSHGSFNSLGLHTDNLCGPFDKQRDGRSPIPRFLGFTGYQSTDGRGIPITTDFLPVESFLKQVPTCLEAWEYQVNPPQSNNCEPLMNVPLVERDENGVALMRFNAKDGQITALTLAASRALGELSAVLQRSESLIIPVDVAYGTILIFDNYRVLHRRLDFNPGVNLKKARWLRRCYACRDINAGMFMDRNRWPFLWK